MLVTNYPAHYRLPLFTLMSDRLRSVGATLTVVFLARDASSRPWLVGDDIAFHHEFLSSTTLPLGSRGTLIPHRLEQRLAQLHPTILVVASLSPLIGLRASRVAHRVGARFGIWSGETPQMTTARSRARRLLRRRLLDTADFAIAYGSRSASYLRAMRSDLPVVLGRNTAPVPALSPHRADRRDEVRFVVIGDLASLRKGTDVALDAARLVPDARVRLLIIGSGRMLPEFHRYARADKRVRLLGSLEPSEVATVLADADALLFPTRADIFGLALVEAMGSQVVPIVARAAGAVDDLAVDGHNAIVVDGHDPACWAEALERVIEDIDLRRKLACRARHTIEARWTMGHAAEAMMAGLRLGVSIGNPR